MKRDLILVSLSLMTWGIGEGMFLFFQPLYMEELGASPVLIGNYLGGIGLAMAAAHLPAGYLSDRFGRRPLLFAAWFMGTTAAWVMALSTSITLFVFGAVFYGLTSFVITPLNSYITAARGNFSVARVLTLISASYNTGAILGPLIGGWIGNNFGLRTNFLIAAICFIASLIIILFISPQPVETPVAKTSGEKPNNLINKRFILFLFAIFISMFFMYIPQPLSQNFLQNARQINLAQIGILISARSIGIVVLNLILGQFNARVGFLIAQGAMALFTVLLWKGNSYLSYFVGYFLLGSYTTAHSFVVAQGSVLVEAANMGLAYGMIETTMAIVFILAPPIAGRLYAIDPILIYSVSFVLILVGIFHTIIISPIRQS